MVKFKESSPFWANNIIKNYASLFIAIVLIILFFHPVIFSDKTFFFRDIHRWFYPMKYFLSTSMKNGSIPYWIPYQFCGTPFISDLQSGVFYPISFVFLLFSFPFSFNLFILIHFFLGFCFFYYFIRESGISRKSAILTGISYCFGGYTIATVNTLNHLSTIIWLPAVLWSFSKAMRQKRISWYFVTTLFLCIAILGGEPQIFILIVALLFFYSLFPGYGGDNSTKFYLKNSLIILFITTAAILITSLQLGMTYMDYKMSARLGGISYDEASRFSLKMNMLKHFILPLHFDAGFITAPDPLNRFFQGSKAIPWLLTVYPGLLIVPMAVIGLFSNYHHKFFWLFTFLFTLILALGDATPLHFLFYKLFPFFRFPAKFIFLTSFSLLIMSAHGFDRVFKFLKPKGVLSGFMFLLILIFMVIDLYSAHRGINPFCESGFYHYHHPSLKPVIDDTGTFRIYSDPEIETPRHIQNTILNHHIKWQMMLSPNLGIFQNLSHVDGVPALELRYQYLITEILNKPWKDKIRFLRLANVKYIISSGGLDEIQAMRNQVDRVNGLVFRVKDYLPRAWIIGDLKGIRDGTVDELIDGSFDPAYTAITKGDIIKKYSHKYFKRVNSLSYDKNGKIHIELTAEEPGILILSESSYPGWRVFVDGEEKECLWLDLLFQGVEIGKGRHKVDFIYRPKYYTIFLSISLISLALFFSIWLFSLWFNSRNVKR